MLLCITLTSFMRVHYLRFFPKPGSYGLIDDEDIKGMIDDHGSEIALVLIGGVSVLFWSGF